MRLRKGQLKIGRAKKVEEVEEKATKKQSFKSNKLKRDDIYSIPIIICKIIHGNL